MKVKPEDCLMSTSKFDLEQRIMECWNICDDINVLYERALDGPHMTEDELGNALLGMYTLYQMKFERLFRTYEEVLHEQYKKNTDNSRHTSKA